MLQSIEDVAPRVIKGVTETVHIDDFTPTTGVAKYRGCFVRQRVKSGADPVLDTILLANNTAWHQTETVGSDNYSNKCFGIIDSYPEKKNDIDGGGVCGKITVQMLNLGHPVWVAFRYLSGGAIAQVPDFPVGKKLWIYGLNVTINGVTYTVPVVSDTTVTGEPEFRLVKIIRPLPLVKDMPTHPKDYGWLVVALDAGFVVDGATLP